MRKVRGASHFAVTSHDRHDTYVIPLRQLLAVPYVALLAFLLPAQLVNSVMHDMLYDTI